MLQAMFSVTIKVVVQVILQVILQVIRQAIVQTIIKATIMLIPVVEDIKDRVVITIEEVIGQSSGDSSSRCYCSHGHSVFPVCRKLHINLNPTFGG